MKNILKKLVIAIGIILFITIVVASLDTSTNTSDVSENDSTYESYEDTDDEETLVDEDYEDETFYSATIGEENALAAAENYLDYSGFSKKGLKSQLKYEGYKKGEIKYAIKNCSANWKEECVECAENYLDYSSFSRDGLYDQLEYEGFTDSQIKYALDKVY